MKEVTMLYRQYKQHYSDCETVADSYNKSLKTIAVLIPDGRVKPSGVRGRRFSGYQLWFLDENGEKKFCSYRAVSAENATKQHKKVCKENGWVPCDPPEGRLAKIFN